MLTTQPSCYGRGASYDELSFSVKTKTKVFAGQPTRCWNCKPEERMDARWNRKKEKPSLSAYKESEGKTGRRRE
jgi:hypothetical protein